MDNYITTRARFDALWDKAERLKNAGEPAKRDADFDGYDGCLICLTDDEYKQLERLRIELEGFEKRSLSNG